MLEMIAYTLVGLALYGLSDWLLNRMETRRGKRFENRSLIFFAIILTLALISFQLIQLWVTP